MILILIITEVDYIHLYMLCVQDMCIHVQRNGPVSRMRELCMSIPEDKCVLLAALIKLFSQVCINL